MRNAFIILELTNNHNDINKNNNNNNCKQLFLCALNYIDLKLCHIYIFLKPLINFTLKLYINPNMLCYFYLYTYRIHN